MLLTETYLVVVLRPIVPIAQAAPQENQHWHLTVP